MKGKKPVNNNVTVKVFKSKLRERVSLIVISGIALVVVVLILLLVDYHHNKLTLSAQHLTNSQLTQQLANDVQQNQYNQAQQAISNSINSQSEPNMILSAELYYKQGNYQKAITAYQAVEKKYGENESIDVNIALMAQLANDKSTAISYYQKAINLLKNQPGTSQAINQLQTKINNLE